MLFAGTESSLEPNGISDSIQQCFENSACKPESQDSESPNQQYTF